jgi:hypothetical protein
MINFLIANPEEAMLWCFLGSGKSLAILSLLAYHRAFARKGRMLIVAPKKVCELTWRQEAKKWAHTQSLTVENMCGGSKHRQYTLFSSKSDILLINYESLGWLQLQLNAYYINKGEELPFEYIVFDEVSKMKRQESKRFKEFSPICRYFKTRIGLTASPASNGIENVWAQIYLLDMGKRLGISFPAFRAQYFHKGSGAHGKWLPYDNEGTKMMVVNKIQDMTLILQSEGNVVLPKCTVIDTYITLTAPKMRDYLQLEAELFMQLENGQEFEVFNSVALSNKLLQVGSGRLYEQEDPDDISTRVTHKIHDLKYQELSQLMDETGEEPILLFYAFTSEKEVILKQHKGNVECMTGVDGDDAVMMMDRFNSGKTKLLIAHSASIGYGVNLQEACSIVVWFTATYNLEHYLQSNGRVDRQGQKNPVRIFRFIAKDTIEEYVFKRLSEKKLDEEGLKDMMLELQQKRGN